MQNVENPIPASLLDPVEDGFKTLESMFGTDKTPLPDFTEFDYLANVDLGFEGMVVRRGELSAQKSEIEAQIKELDIPIAHSLIAAGLPTGIKSVQVGKYRVARVDETTTPSFDKQAMARYLVEQGVSADLVMNAVLFATTEKARAGFVTIADTTKERGKRKK